MKPKKLRPTKKQQHQQDIAWYSAMPKDFLVKQLLEEREKVRVITTDTRYQGGVQWWIQKHNQLLMQNLELAVRNGILELERCDCQKKKPKPSSAQQTE